jgi:hypothetical protein
MQVVLIILSVILLGFIIYYAVSSKSSRIVKLSALIALGLIGLSLGVASIVLVVNSSNHDDEEPRLPVFLNPTAETPKKSNTVEIIIFLVFLAAIIGLIAVVTSRDRKIRQQEAKKAGPSRIFGDADKHEDLGEKADAPPDKAKEDDGFNLELE